MEKVLEIDQLTKVFSLGQHAVEDQNNGGRPRVVLHQAGRDICSGRRKRLREDDYGEDGVGF